MSEWRSCSERSQCAPIWPPSTRCLLAEQPITMALIAAAVAESKVLIRPGLAEMLARAPRTTRLRLAGNRVEATGATAIAKALRAPGER